ncbi:NUDIX domain-containing protein [Limnobacter sp.]|uniref:NUDIX hydrolase n=1 Tax=Limnobacter sp. TaxID=2003368 RepID=UPI003512A482
MQCSTPLADRGWVHGTLHAAFAPFAAQWRDHSAPQAKGFIDLSFLGQAQGHVAQEAWPDVAALARAAGFDTQLAQQSASMEWAGPPHTLETALAELATGLRKRGHIVAWRDELQSVRDPHDAHVAALERGGFKPLGLCSQAVHVHVETPCGLVWAGVRSASKKENPGMLDNLAAGGVAHPEDAQKTVARELFEEAGLRVSDLHDLRPLAWPKVTVSRPLLQGGWHHETLWLYRATTRPGVCPHNHDGEVAKFQLMTRTACVAAINRWAFTPDAALCAALAMTEGRM